MCRVVSIEPTPHGTHRARWREHGRSRSKTFKRKVDAENFLKRIHGEQVRGLIGTPHAGRLTVEAWAEQWLASARGLGQGGRDTYRRDLDRHVIPTLGDHRIDRVTDEDIDELLTEKLKAGYAPSTVHRIYRTLHRLFAYAVERRKLAVNPCAPVEPPPVPHTEMRFLTVDQVDELADAIGHRYRAWVLTSAYAGIRWSESVGLQRQRVEGKRLRIADQLIQRSDGQWHRDPPKTKAGRRTISLPVFLADELAAHLDQWSRPGPTGLVFPNRNGQPMRNSNFSAMVFKPALRRAGLDPLTRVHDLRHTAVALAIKAGAHPKAIQARMGHASITVTLDRYGHLFPEMDDQIADGLEALRLR